MREWLCVRDTPHSLWKMKDEEKVTITVHRIGTTKIWLTSSKRKYTPEKWASVTLSLCVNVVVENNRPIVSVPMQCSIDAVDCCDFLFHSSSKFVSFNKQKSRGTTALLPMQSKRTTLIHSHEHQNGYEENHRLFVWRVQFRSRKRLRLVPTRKHINVCEW